MTFINWTKAKKKHTRFAMLWKHKKKRYKSFEKSLKHEKSKAYFEFVDRRFLNFIYLQFASATINLHGVCGLFRLLPDSLNLLFYLVNLFSVSPSLVVWDHGGELVNLLLVLPVVV
jgi:hypothetical protein